MPSSLDDRTLLERLVRVDSTSSRSNLPIADLIEQYLARPGVHIERFGPSDEPKTNLLVTLGPPATGSRAGLVLCGHMDAVPANEPEWISDPFTLTERDGCWFGRGSSDMKGFLALAMQLARRIDPESLAAPLWLLFTYDEESGTRGARHLVRHWPADRPMPRAVVIGEPTSLRPMRMNKGHLTLRVSLHGRSAHSGYPHLGDNAIEKAAPVLEALRAVRLDLEAERSENSLSFPDVPFVALNAGRITGGSAVNIVPDLCEITLGARLLPGMESGSLQARLQDRIRAAEPSAALEVINESPPMRSPADSRLRRFLMDLVGSSDDLGVNFATDGGWLQTLGVECVLFGPGSIEVAHRPNEFVPIEDMRRGAELLERIVEHFCR